MFSVKWTVEKQLVLKQQKWSEKKDERFNQFRYTKFISDDEKYTGKHSQWK